MVTGPGSILRRRRRANSFGPSSNRVIPNRVFSFSSQTKLMRSSIHGRNTALVVPESAWTAAANKPSGMWGGSAGTGTLASANRSPSSLAMTVAQCCPSSNERTSNEDKPTQGINRARIQSSSFHASRRLRERTSEVCKSKAVRTAGLPCL